MAATAKLDGMPKVVSEACYLRYSNDVDEELLNQGTGLRGAPKVEQNLAYLSIEQFNGHPYAYEPASRCIPWR